MLFVLKSRFQRLHKCYLEAKQREHVQFERIRLLQKENQDLIEDLTDEQNISNDLRRQLKQYQDPTDKIAAREPIKVAPPDNDFDPKKKSHYEGGW